MNLRSLAEGLSMADLIQPAGEEGPGPKRLSYDQIKKWNAYRRSRPNITSLQQLVNGFFKENPTADFTPADIQNEIQQLGSRNVREALRKGFPTGSNTNSDFIFPDVIENGKNMGPINGDMHWQGAPPATQSRNLPKTPPKGYGPESVFEDGGGLFYKVDDMEAQQLDPSYRYHPEYQRYRGSQSTGATYTIPGTNTKVPLSTQQGVQFYIDPKTQNRVNITR